MATEDYGLEQKFCRLGEGVTVTDGTVIEGYASLFGLTDQGGDVVAPGAYRGSLKRLAEAERRVKLLWQHDPAQPIGVWDELEHQIRLEREEAGAMQRLHLHQVQIARHRQPAGKLAEFDHPHRCKRDLRAVSGQPSERRAQAPGESLVDELERWHARAHDPLLPPDIVAPHATVRAWRDRDGWFGCNPAQQCVDFFLREDVFSHATV